MKDMEMLSTCGRCEHCTPPLVPVQCVSLDCPITFARVRVRQALQHAAQSLQLAADIYAKDNQLDELPVLVCQRQNQSHRPPSVSSQSSSSDSSLSGFMWGDGGFPKKSNVPVHNNNTTNYVMDVDAVAGEEDEEEVNEDDFGE